MLNRCIKPGNRRLLWSTLTIVAVIGCGSQPASAQNASQMCASEPLLALETGASFIPSSCTVPAGGILLESLYYQNASHVGGTALAAYPLLQVTAGVARRVEFIADLPSQVGVRRTLVL
jgi:hypothetical protein